MQQAKRSVCFSCDVIVMFMPGQIRNNDAKITITVDIGDSEPQLI